MVCANLMFELMIADKGKCLVLGAGWAVGFGGGFGVVVSRSGGGDLRLEDGINCDGAT